MDNKHLLLLIIFLLFNLIKNNSIIRIPSEEGRFENISTKNGFINYEFKHEQQQNYYWRFPIIFTIYRLEGIRNISLYNFTEFKYIFDIEFYGKNNDSFKLTIQSYKDDIYNNAICKILYKTHYIDKNIYALGILNKRKYKFFGGIPKNIIKVKKLDKFTFNKNDKVSQMKIDYINGTSDIFNLEGEKRLVSIKEDLGLFICIPLTYRLTLMKQYKDSIYREDLFKSYDYYGLDEKQQRIFPNISFKIGNNTITLNRDNSIFKSKKDGQYYLRIDQYPCDKFIFGKKFLDLFDFKAFDLASCEVNLYIGKKKNNIIKKIQNNKILNLSFNSNLYIVIVLLTFSIFIGIALLKNYHKNKKIKNYNNYYKI